MQRDQILRYLNESASSEEQKEVESWIKASPENAKDFYILRAKYIASTFDETVKAIDVEKGYQRFQKRIGKSPKSKSLKIYAATFKYAAILILLVGIGYFLKYMVLDDIDTYYTPQDAITLQLENGDIQIIEINGSTKVVDPQGSILGTQQGNTLIYTVKSLNTEKLSYNRLTVPYGRKFNLFLSDGTSVVLNAGTSIKYPVKFMKEGDREIYLNGEAYFDVAKDKDHPFIVNTGDLKVRVLGTKFNVSAYPEDNTLKTMLVEGSVALYDAKATSETKNITYLEPGYLGSLNKTSKKIRKDKAEIALHTGWMHGDLVFRHDQFKNILKKLERQFNVSITNKNKKLDNEVFTASFTNTSLDDILKTFKEHYGIDYHIEKSKIIIDP